MKIESGAVTPTIRKPRTESIENKKTERVEAPRTEAVETSPASTRAAGRLSEFSSTSRALTGDNEAPADTSAISVEEATEHEAEHGHDPSGDIMVDGTGMAEEKMGESKVGTTGKEPPVNDGVIADGLETGEPQTYVNNNGDEVEFQVEQVEGTEDHDSYTITIGNDQVTVNIPPGEDAEEVLGRVTDYYSQQDDSVRGAVHTINIEEGANPEDDYWAEEYDSPGFVSAATGGNGEITFWNGSRYLSEGVFNHEYGHNIGSAVRDAQNDELNWVERVITGVVDGATGDDRSQHVPRGQSDAIEQDGNSVSDYGDNSISEDFAEFYDLYREAEEAGPKHLEALRRQFPERFALFEEEVLSRDLNVAA